MKQVRTECMVLASLLLIMLPACAVVRDSDFEGDTMSPVASRSASYGGGYAPSPSFGTLDHPQRAKYRQQAEQMSDEELLDWCESRYREYTYSYATLVLLRSMGHDNPFKSNDQKDGWGPLDDEISELYVYVTVVKATLEEAIVSPSRSLRLLAYEVVALWNDEFFQRMEDLLIRIAGEGFGYPNAEEIIDLSSLYLDL